MSRGFNLNYLMQLLLYILLHCEIQNKDYYYIIIGLQLNIMQDHVSGKKFTC